MRKIVMKMILCTVVLLSSIFISNAQETQLPIRGLHCSAPSSDDIPLAVRFIREDLPKEGVNVLVLEFNYRYQYTSHPELVDSNALTNEEVKQLVSACKEANVQLIPQFNCLGHQSWSKRTAPLLREYPEFDETPGKYPDNEGIYCRSYCPLHPEVHEVIFALIDELADVCEADAFHVGMDEVFLLGEDACPRCKGKNKAELFAGEVKRLHDHLAEDNRTMWMWGDRFINGEVTGLGKWSASLNDTAPSINMVPKDIVICDWHYRSAPPTPGYFSIKGFDVVCSPWRKPEVALAQLQHINLIREHSNKTLASRAKGVLQTTWCGMGRFIRAYHDEDSVKSESAKESADCFKQLFQAIRSKQ